MSELIQRVVTAAVALIVVVALALWAPAWWWALFIAATVALAAWEWGKLVGLSPIAAVGFSTVVVVVLALLWRATGLAIGAVIPEAAAAVMILAVFFWIVVAPLQLLARQHLACPWLGTLVGFIVLVPAGLAAIGLREASAGLLLAAALIVWVADTAAFFVGRKYGSTKLAPDISPGKTWAGGYGALGAVAVYALGLYPVFGAQHALSLFGWLLAMAGVTVLAIVGDLYESWLKRGAGVKDSGNWLPGHGGVLDRIDALLPVLPLLALWWLGW